MSDLLRRLLEDPPALHVTEGGRLVSFGISEEVGRYLHSRVEAESVTLETGAGISTILFALKGARHHCVVPDLGLTERIVDWCEREGVETGRLSFHVARSEEELPALARSGPALDLLLIDGRHAFPSPFIDWYYGASMLAVGGSLIVDDIHLWPCALLAEFLRGEPEWEVEGGRSGRAAVFRKVGDGSHERWWFEQPTVVARSKRLQRRLKWERRLRKLGLRR